MVTIITSPAPNLGAVRESERSAVPAVLSRRMELVLSIAVIHGHRNLVLGAWGTSDSDLWAVGLDGAAGAVAHWEGRGWAAVPMAPAQAPLQAVHGSGGHVWMVGDAGQVLHFGPSP